MLVTFSPTFVLDTKIIFTHYVVVPLTLYDGGPYQIETSPLISRANQWTGFYMIGTSVMKELKYFLAPRIFC